MASRYMVGSRTLTEMKEFAGLSARAQRYIRRALDIAFDRRDVLAHGAQSPAEARAIARHSMVYQRLAFIRGALPDDLEAGEPEFLGNLILVSAYDLAQGQLPDFSSYRFLYERLLGAAARPYLPPAFCGAASLPLIHPRQRIALLKSLSENAASASAWSEREPMFFPDWIERDEIRAG